MSWKSCLNDLLVYINTRLLSWPVMLLWFVLTSTAIYISSYTNLFSIGSKFLLMGLLILQFRLWDDLADHVYDKANHPERILIMTPHLDFFKSICIGISLPIILILLVTNASYKFLSYFCLCLAMAAIYQFSTRFSTNMSRLVRAHLILLKYPVFIALVASNYSLNIFIYLSLSSWFILSLIDLVTDPSLQTSRYWQILAAIEFLTLLMLIVFFILKEIF